jgi:hypothetical protein
MNDDDLDTRLRDHGTSWRQANQDRPGIDWDAVTTVRRSKAWLAVAGVSVAAAAVIIPVVLTVGGGSSSRPRPAKHPSPSPTSERAGAPSGFFALHNGFLDYVGLTTGGEGGGHPQHSPGLEVGARADGSMGYGAFPMSGCKTEIDKIALVTDAQHPTGAIIQSTVTTILGGAPVIQSDGLGIAVSPDDTKLAMVLSTVREVNGKKNCSGPEQLVMVNLVTHAVRRWNGSSTLSYLERLQWAPDSERLAYLAPPLCCHSVAMYRVLDTSAPGSSYSAPPPVLPVFDGHHDFGPVFWWHGQMVATNNDSLYLLNGHGGVGAAVARGFPTELDSVSSDPTGDHLLLSSRDVTYRWDNGYLSVVKGNWSQPGW